MSLLYDTLLRFSILKELDRQTKCLAEQELCKQPVPVYTLLVALKIKREYYHGARLLMLERDEIGSTVLNGSEHIYLKEKGLIVLYGRRYGDRRRKDHQNNIPAFIDVLTRKFANQ